MYNFFYGIHYAYTFIFVHFFFPYISFIDKLLQYFSGCNTDLFPIGKYEINAHLLQPITALDLFGVLIQGTMDLCPYQCSKVECS